MTAKPFRIGKRWIGPGKPVFIIAEAGVNHNGDVRIAKDLIAAAAHAGADAVKFQTFKTASIASKIAGLAKYHKNQYKKATRMREMLERLELSEEDHRVLWAYAKSLGILPLSSPYDLASVDLLIRVGAYAIKIPSGEITNVNLLRYIARKNRPVILSTGMATIEEIITAVEALRRGGSGKIAILHCVSSYHTPCENANLLAIRTLTKKFDYPVGYSDHTMGVEMAVAAVALGACVIEKHMTLDRSMPGPDQKVSLTPGEFKTMVDMVRNVYKGLGTGRKGPSLVEREAMRLARKSLVAARDLKKGTVLRREDIETKRPGTGISPKHMDELVGAVMMKNIKADTLFSWSHIT
jgi:N-acetylneuraminate synthase